jgi:hypothetical protein
LSQKKSVVLYLDAELVKESGELGFNLSRTFENPLKRLATQVDDLNAERNSHGSWAGPDLNRRPSAGTAGAVVGLMVHQRGDPHAQSNPKRT